MDILQERTKDMLKIAVKIYGESRKLLIGANYIYKLIKYLDEPVQVYAFGTDDEELNEAMLGAISGIEQCALSCEWGKLVYENYHIVFSLDVYPILEYVDEKCLANRDKLKKLVETWLQFRECEDNALFFRERKQYRPYAYVRMIIEEKKLINSADIGGLLELKNEYELPIRMNADKDELFEKYNIGDKYITIQCRRNSTLSWIKERFEELVNWIKLKYPDYQIVQIGENGYFGETIEGVDVNLANQLRWEEVKCVLYNSLLHIDGDSFLSQLRQALHAGKSIVLFGATPNKLLANDLNVNIDAGVCKHWCMSLREDWEYHCIQGETEPPCMRAITVDMVKNHLVNIL